MTRKKAKIVKLKCEFTGRSYRNYNRIAFQDQIRLAKWDILNDNIHIDEQWDLFKQNMANVIDNMCQKKTFRINHIKQPWITLRLLELILDKDKALKKAKKL